MSDVNKIAEEMNRKYGYVNYKTMIEEFGATAHSIFDAGGVKKICSDNGYGYRCASRVAPEEIENDFMRVYKELGDISIEKYIENGKYSKTAIRTAFGSVNGLMKKLGIPLNTSRMEDDDVILADIKRVVDEYKSTSSSTYRKYGNYSQSVIERIWGNWDAALHEIGLSGVGKRVGRESMINELKELYVQHGFLSKPLIDESCEFTYQASCIALGGKSGISCAVGVNDAFARSKSTGQQLLSEILGSLFCACDVVEEATFGWLRNPVTGRLLYVDFFVKPLSVCIEYDGLQHFTHTRFFHETESSFAKAKYRDSIKDRLIPENGLTLVRISYREKLSENYIKTLLNL